MKGVLAGFICVFGVVQASAQEASSDARLFHLGFRVSIAPLNAFDVSTVETSTTNPVADYKYTGTNFTHRMMGGPVGEMRMWSRLSLLAELDLHQAEYKQTAEKRLGTRDTSASTDTRSVQTLVETTKAKYWDVPLLVRYRGLATNGLFSKLYVNAGPTLRHISRVRTSNEITNFDGSTDYNETPTKPVKTNLLGFSVGVGFRFIDEVGIRLTPEVRFTKWMDYTFKGVAYRSVQNQVEAGIGISF